MILNTRLLYHLLGLYQRLKTESIKNYVDLDFWLQLCKGFVLGGLSAVLMKTQTASNPRPFTRNYHCNRGHKVQELQLHVPWKVLEFRQ